jgi:hypothetical protein
MFDIFSRARSLYFEYVDSKLHRYERYIVRERALAGKTISGRRLTTLFISSVGV